MNLGHADEKSSSNAAAWPWPEYSQMNKHKCEKQQMSNLAEPGEMVSVLGAQQLVHQSVERPRRGHAPAESQQRQNLVLLLRRRSVSKIK